MNILFIIIIITYINYYVLLLTIDYQQFLSFTIINNYPMALLNLV